MTILFVTLSVILEENGRHESIKRTIAPHDCADHWILMNIGTVV